MEQNETARGSGRTTRQMQAAPKHATYVWCNDVLVYPLMLARRLGREDLNIVTPVWLTEYRYVGLELTGLVIDHALPTMACSRRDQDALEYHIERAMLRVNNRVPT